ncbi:MAG: hypothetical protein J5742_04560 [Alphaproteobacteria bacterium]|nr:hypothetical protein [Alphaproteobacteria bacterium]
MKKLLNISVIAALAILPLAANADPVAGDPVHDDNGAVASAAPKYQLAEANSTVDGVVATAGYVKGAYNAAIKAINKVATTAGSALQKADITTGGANGTIAVGGTDVAVKGLGTAAYTASTDYATAAQGEKADTAVQTVKLNGTALTEDSDGAVNVTAVQTVTTGDANSGNGTIKVDGNAVSVYGLGSAAYSATTDYISSAAGSVKTANIDDEQVTKAKLDSTVQASLDKADNALQQTDLATYATQTGAAATAAAAVNGATIDLSGIQATTASLTGSVPVVDTWGATTTATNPVSVTLSQNSVVTGLTGNTANVANKISAGTVTYNAQ